MDKHNEKQKRNAKSPEEKQADRREWRKKNSKKVQENRRKWLIKNKDKVNERRREQYKKDPTRRRQQNADWLRKNEERYKEIALAYRKNNKEKLGKYRKSIQHIRNELSSLRRARERRAKPKWYEKKEVRNFYRRASRRGLSVDHIVPLTSDVVTGLHCLANLRMVTREENSAKGNRYWPDM